MLLRLGGGGKVLKLLKLGGGGKILKSLKLGGGGKEPKLLKLGGGGNVEESPIPLRDGGGGSDGKPLNPIEFSDYPKVGGGGKEGSKNDEPLLNVSKGGGGRSEVAWSDGEAGKLPKVKEGSDCSDGGGGKLFGFSIFV